MATSDQIRALITSHLQNDNDRFLSVAIQVAAHAARQGHGRIAEEIRNLVDQAKQAPQPRNSPIPITAPKGDIAALLSVSYPDTRLSDMILSEELDFRLLRILREQHARQRLLEYGLQPRRKILLIGPPGSGKTMTAAALAGELKLPLYTLLLHGILTKFLGESAVKLRLVFDTIKAQRGVYLFDEVDAIGSQRSGNEDIGEIRRLLNSFLLFLEQDDSSSLLIAATNHPELLDRALFRRFDEILEYTLPPGALVKETLQKKLALFNLNALDWEILTTSAVGLSYADLASACSSAAKEAILNETTTLTTPPLLRALHDRKQKISFLRADG